MLVTSFRFSRLVVEALDLLKDILVDADRSGFVFYLCSIYTAIGIKHNITTQTQSVGDSRCYCLFLPEALDQNKACMLLTFCSSSDVIDGKPVMPKYSC